MSLEQCFQIIETYLKNNPSHPFSFDSWLDYDDENPTHIYRADILYHYKGDSSNNMKDAVVSLAMILRDLK